MQKAVRYLRYGTVFDLISRLNSVADPGTGSFLTPGSGIGKNPDPGSVMNILDLVFKNSFWVENTKFFDANPDPGSCQP
jgi:hypothetical protein